MAKRQTVGGRFGTGGLVEISQWTPLIVAMGSLIGLLVIMGSYRRARDQDDRLIQTQREPIIIPPISMWTRLPKISFLVAAWNEADQIMSHIQRFSDLTYPNRELILAAGGQDGTLNLASQHAKKAILVFEQHAGEGKQQALARIVAESSGEIIYLTDADCLLDDQVVNQLVYPIAMGFEQVCTGASRPSAEQLAHPFVFSQAASQLYATLQTPDYAPGLLGRNCAIDRQLLLASDGLAAPAPTGTDYVLAKELTAAGVTIRQLPQSQVVTHYPTSPKAYIQQQRRWIRNVFLYGRRYNATSEMNTSLRSSLIGLLMLGLPFTFFIFGVPAILIWWLLVIHALLSRFRYLTVASHIWQRPLHLRDYLWQFPLLLLDFVAWVQPLADYVQPRRQLKW